MKTINFSEIDKSNIFYPLISIFFLSVHGIEEFACRDLILDLKLKSKNINDYYNLIEKNPLNLPDYLKQDLKDFKAFTPMVFSFEANKKLSKDSYYFDLEETLNQNILSKEISKNITKLAEMLIISSYEVFRTFNPKNNEVLEFFRHVRNAAAHNGKFYFDKNVIDKTSNQLKKSAKWSNFEIKAELQNFKLFNSEKKNNDNFWEYGDLIDFLLDLENQFPELKNKN